ncbi:MSCRAMM family protein [Bifidobacterium gallicum]|uniref:Fibronectin binding protein n=1 Tax=Bifidobacterium gallicum DSM 20093 = LMG 11596 TaxID=561180 RepID=D1NT93_9BIFI|nr:prealbumin-like fold domain-containing protein [Bifidobacterium gallicum]EFA22947.1 hypothetical protein BIFGAL_03050 [Bifidobacterium gallicum DSM 20093 = LMG 11596]KFI57727.1 fibronectin binding protein [Bifidobacterium gallicum DSM 20093 = LMG 11596]
MARLLRQRVLFWLHVCDQAQKQRGHAQDCAPTDGDGLVTFSNLAPGRYWLNEADAPDGYQRVGYWWFLYIDDAGHMKIAERKNVNPNERLELEDINLDTVGLVDIGTVEGVGYQYPVGNSKNSTPEPEPEPEPTLPSAGSLPMTRLFWQMGALAIVLSLVAYDRILQFTMAPRHKAMRRRVPRHKAYA